MEGWQWILGDEGHLLGLRALRWRHGREFALIFICSLLRLMVWEGWELRYLHGARGLQKIAKCEYGDRGVVIWS
jgi:hypothetical protein